MTPNTKAALHMTAAVFLWSWEPVAITATNTDTTPIAFLFWFHLPQTLCWTAYLTYRNPTLLKTITPKTITPHLQTKTGALALAGTYPLLLFFYATQHIDTTIVTIIFSTHTILFVNLRQKQNQQHTPLTNQNWTTLTTATAGSVLVILSQTGQLNPTNTHNLLTGITLAAGAATLLSWAAHTLKLSEKLHTQLKNTHPQTTKTDTIYLTSLYINTISLLTNIPILAATNQTTPPHIIAGITLIGTLSWLGTAAFWHANITTTNLGINTIQYLRPALSLLWLLTLTTTTIHHTDWLLIGSAATIAAALLHNTPTPRLRTHHTPPQ